MKKTIFTSIVLTSLAAGVLLFSCKKQETVQPQNPVNETGVSVKNNRLVFSTKEEYRRLVDHSSPAQMIQFTSKVKAMNNFTSYSVYVASKNPGVLSAEDSIDDDFMKTILNADAAVQIGDYIYKIDMGHEKVYALNTTYADQYPDVVHGNTANPHVRAFSISEDVLSLSGNETALGKYEDDGGTGGGGGGGSGPCNDCTIGTNKIAPLDTTYTVPFVSGTQNREIDCKLKYERYGIYFTLYSRMDNNGTNDQTQFLLDVYVYYHVHNGDTNGPYTVTDYTNGNTVGALKYQSYDGSKPIAWMWFRGRWKIKVTDGSLTVTYPPTSWKELRFNI